MAHKILGAALIVALGVILLISERDWVLRNRPAVDHVATIPQGEGRILSHLDELIFDYGMHVPHAPAKAQALYRLLAAAGRVPAPPPADHRPPRPRYGYAVREITFLGMPFGWYANEGFTLYTDDADELVIAPLVEAADRELHREVGTNLRAGFFFPFWNHLWGWLYLAALALWGWLFHRATVRRREALGLI